MRVSLLLGAAFVCALVLLTLQPTSAADSCLTIRTQAVANVDLERVRETWLSWVNTERATLGLPPYNENAHLNATAGNWSTFSAEKGWIDHKRYWQSPYYDYAAVGKWFASKGLTFENDSGKTYTESIGWGMYKCSTGDCTDELLTSIRSTFDFFKSEKGKQYAPHYNAFVSAKFTMTGLGIAINASQGRYYLTAHYGTSITSEPPALCIAMK